MELVKTIEISGKKISYNISAVVMVEYAAKFQKNLFDIFNAFAKFNQKNEEELTVYLMENASILSDFIEVAYTAISISNNNKNTYEEFLREYQLEDLIKASAEIVKNLYISNKPINKPQIKAKNSKKK